MTFDKPEHKEIAQQLVARATYPGHLLELALEFKKAVDAAEIARPPTDVFETPES